MPTPGYRLTTVLELSDFTMPAECTVDRLEWNFIRFTNRKFQRGTHGTVGPHLPQYTHPYASPLSIDRYSLWKTSPDRLKWRATVMARTQFSADRIDERRQRQLPTLPLPMTPKWRTGARVGFSFT